MNPPKPKTPKPQNQQQKTNKNKKPTKPPGGHYTAHALQADGRWYRFNDAAVTHVAGGAAQVGRERAYMLVYQRASA